MLSEKTYLKIMRGSAIYDLVVTSGFATPFTFALGWGHLTALHTKLNLAGEVPQAGLYLTFMASLMGSVVVIWSLARLKINRAVLGRFDGAGRALFSAWMVWALSQGASGLIYFLLVPEVAWMVVQFLPYRKAA
ncbi:MAG TPA: hypothetical protein ENK83_06275 [Aliiroseovarius sp.]|nr:hypothetical protein [Aliiroseovarius sp.]